ncbi:MAG TPA: hypothetical protein VNC17_02945 [Thermoleophilaceae bacterium]|nr:hypothetical protein [Thermoleophilaceae bacterium]
MGIPQPPIKRYALVPDREGRGVRRFHLARVAPSSRSALGVDRLERMEEIAELDTGRENGSKPRRSDV